MFHIQSRPFLHLLFETLGYAVGFALYNRKRRKTGDVIEDGQRWSVIAAASIGGLLGSRFLGVLNDSTQGITLKQLVTPGGGKTIVGGLLGGWLLVEITKRLQGIKTRTGDLFAVPLCVGIAIGRIGCLFGGLSDDTYGKPSSLPWAVDFGDGIARHPTQAYEIILLATLAIGLHFAGRRSQSNGVLFRLFLGYYLAWRFAIDFLKPQQLVAGMSCIQWACVAGLAILALDEWSAFGTRQAPRGRYAES
jgi:phosphatidylglycerol---prolipoprotein diacylglyceryl transferase